MSIRFNNPLKPSKTRFDAAVKIVLVGIFFAGFSFILGSAIIEKYSPERRADEKAARIIREQSETDLRWCLREANHDQEQIAKCKVEYIQREVQ
ncbi:hypothetical protein [Pseudomonas phage D6]|nr:hypothetical protein [Pseudomonas phage D6]